jgi:hypothetical protein
MTVLSSNSEIGSSSDAVQRIVYSPAGIADEDRNSIEDCSQRAQAILAAPPRQARKLALNPLNGLPGSGYCYAAATRLANDTR